ncbi:MAG: hypothetical protein ACREMA_10325, partial [Longimicrobiales bacterium]
HIGTVAVTRGYCSSARRVQAHFKSIDALADKKVTMAKVRIFKKDGAPTSYFWSNKHRGNRELQTVYKQTSHGVKRINGVRFNALTNTMHKHTEA